MISNEKLIQCKGCNSLSKYYTHHCVYGIIYYMDCPCCDCLVKSMCIDPCEKITHIFEDLWAARLEYRNEDNLE